MGEFSRMAMRDSKNKHMKSKDTKNIIGGSSTLFEVRPLTTAVKWDPLHKHEIGPQEADGAGHPSKPDECG